MAEGQVFVAPGAPVPEDLPGARRIDIRVQGDEALQIVGEFGAVVVLRDVVLDPVDEVVGRLVDVVGGRQRRLRVRLVLALGEVVDTGLLRVGQLGLDGEKRAPALAVGGDGVGEQLLALGGVGGVESGHAASVRTGK